MIDLRSDTVTNPTEAMLDAMRRAELGDDSRDGDPTVGKLEALAASRVGKDAGVFMPSGTMGNLVALMAHTGRGGEVLLEEGSHILKSEMGGAAHVAGLFHRTVRGKRGAMDVGLLAGMINAQMKPNKLATALIEMETTHNGAGGTVLPLDHMAEVHALGREHGIPVHVDGARLFNAAVALGVPAERIVRHCDSVTFCVSKGLSAPIGSLLCGSKDFIVRARGFRRMLGGNLRQAGMLAAAGIVALESMIDRLADDHRTAKQLAEGLHLIAPGLVDPKTIETNIVRVDTSASGWPAEKWSAALQPHGVRVSAGSPTQLRFVTHRHIAASDIETTLQAFRDLWREVPGGQDRSTAVLSAGAGRSRPR
jgi:threonine aldolase